MQPTLETIRNSLPEYAKDIKLNLQSVLTSSHLTPAQVYGTAIASAAATGNKDLLGAFELDALTAGVEVSTIEDAKAAAAIMAMNNVYYRFKHMIGKIEYNNMQAKLRMNRITNVLASKTDFELFSLAVSAINGCESCIRAHEKVVINGNVTDAVVHDVVRIASVVNSTAAVLTIL